MSGPATTPGPVGVVGLGRMGLPMAKNLLAAGFDVVVSTRSDGPRQEAVEAGAEAASDLVDLGRRCSCVVTMLPDLPEVEAVCDGERGLLAQAAPGTVVLVMGTVSPVRLRDWATSVAERGHHVLDAPVSGGDVGARDATLSIMVGGPTPVVASVRPLLDALGTTVRHLGPLGAGQLAKACNQAVVASTLATLAEALTLGVRGGLDPADLLDVLAGGLAGSRVLEVKRSNYLSDDYAPGGAAAFQHKDLGFVLEAARDAGVAVPVAALVDQLFGAMRWTGQGQLDHSGVVRIVESLSGPLT